MEVNLAHSIAAYYTHAKPRAMFGCIYLLCERAWEFFVSQIIRTELHTNGRLQNTVNASLRMFISKWHYKS